MPPAFGVWFRDYPGKDEVISMLQIHWEAHLANEYVPASQFKTPEDVAMTLKRGFSDEDYIQTHVYRAWLEYQQDRGKPSHLEWPRKASWHPVKSKPIRLNPDL